VAPRPIVVKIGGSTLGSHDTTLQDLVALQRDNVDVVVVHGGGNIISQWMGRQGAVPRFVRGLRVTDQEGLEIVVAVLAGLVNKQLVTTLTSLGARAIGLSGTDGGMLKAKVSDPELGLVGQVTEVDPTLLSATLQAGYMPVVAPLGYREDDDGGEAGILNINGDTAAGELALAANAERLVFLTDVSGVMDNNGRVMRRLDPRQARALLSSGVAGGGMIPKLQACLRALEGVPITNIVDGRKPGALVDCLEGRGEGTRVQA
jgi:acetylglutamate kinase